MASKADPSPSHPPARRPPWAVTFLARTPSPVSDIGDELRIQAIWKLGDQRLDAHPRATTLPLRIRSQRPVFPCTVQRNGVVGFHLASSVSAQPAQPTVHTCRRDPAGGW